MVPPIADRKAIVKEIHHDLGHMGMKKVLSMLTDKYYWNNRLN
jgi:hypothetical protein